ncbi:MAG: YfhO family protein, partial [Chloroflexota bacterium]|nr:YfhO family protein [Chloroflexota bacterium]
SQELSVWAGQGALYSLLGAATYAVYTTLLDHRCRGKPLWARVGNLVALGLLTTLCTVFLSAWSVFPRIELLPQSNLSGGYPAVEAQFIGGATLQVLATYVRQSTSYVGAVVALLVLATPFRRPNRAQTFYLSMVVLMYLSSMKWLVDLARTSSSARSILGLVPGMLEVHLHYPQRIAFVYVFFVACLAAVTLDDVLSAPRRLALSLPLAIGIGLCSLLALEGWAAFRLHDYGLFVLGLALASLVLLAVWSGRLRTRPAAVILVVLTAGELIFSASAKQAQFVEAENASIRFGDAESYYDRPPAPAAKAVMRSAEAPARYIEYSVAGSTSKLPAWRWNRVYNLKLQRYAMIHGLENPQDAQGYNPIHLSVYDRLLTVANASPLENYHDAYLDMPRALSSPLLDMLNVRYVLAHRPFQLGAKLELLAQTEQVSLYSNPSALPRAWVTHHVIVRDDTTALRLIEDGDVDPRRTSVVSVPVNGIRPSAGDDGVRILRYGSDEISLRARLSSPGLVVLSELDYPAWKVKVDGAAQPVVRANGALRAVMVPEGSHTITWTYSSLLTDVGIVLSAVFVVLLLPAFALWPRLSRAVSLQGRRRNQEQAKQA